MDAREVREAVESLKKDRLQNCTGTRKDIDVLLSLADSFLAADGEIAEKKRVKYIKNVDSMVGCQHCERAIEYCKCHEVYNSALDAVRPLIVKKDLRVKELEDALRKIVSRTCVDYKHIYEVAESALKKEG